MKTHKKLARIGANGERIAIPSIWSKILPLNVKCVPEVATLKNFHDSPFLNFVSGLLSKIKLIGTPIASDYDIFVNKLVKSNEI